MADVRPRQAPAEGGQDTGESARGAALAKAGGDQTSGAGGSAPGVVAAGAGTRAAMARGALAPWRSPALVVARETLTHYYAGGWLACEALLAAALAILMLGSADDTAHVFGSACVGLGLLGIVFAAALAHGALSSQWRAPLVRVHGAGAYLRGVLLAAGLVRAGMCVLVVALALALGRMADASAGSVLAGTMGLIALCVLVSALVVVVSSPLTSRGERLVLLAGLDGALYSLAGTGWLAGVLAILRLPLLPVVLCYEVSVAGALSWGWLSTLVLTGGYVAALVWLGGLLLARAERTEHAGTASVEQGAEPVKP